MELFDTRAVIEAANGDGEFKIAARLWNSTVRLDAGERAFALRVRDGRIEGFDPLNGPAATTAHWDVRIAAPESDWRELLRPVPKPFFQDLMAAIWRQDFRVEGDLVGFFPYYRAINRLFELMRVAPAA